MKKYLKFLALIFVFSTACEKEEEAPVVSPSSSLDLAFEHIIDSDSLQFDNTFYTNAAGNEYRVTFLKYIISGVELYTDGKRMFRQNTDPTVISARYVDSRMAPIPNAPLGTYDSIAFSMGVVPEYNYDNAFELSYNDLGMYWPTSLGGGYHFMRFEGHWRDGAVTGGYAFHIGQNENLITIGFPVNLTITKENKSQLTFLMNLNEWFDNPHFYDLTVESGYTMGDTIKMNMLVENGHNVFSLKN